MQPQEEPMTVQALTFAAGLLAGIAAAGAIAAVLHHRWADEHHYRTVRLQATRVRQLHDSADHEYRLSRRRGRALEALGRIHDEVVGDLLDKVAARDRTIARLRRHQPRHLRRNPMPDYGRWRAA
jgi:hypothetical protein